VFLSADPRLEGPIANTEIFMAPWILVAALLSLRAFGTARPRFALGFAAGLSLGVAVAFKQVAAVNAPLLLALFWLRAPRGERLASTARFTGALAAGMATIWAARSSLWFGLRGGLPPRFDANRVPQPATLGSPRGAGTALATLRPPLLPSRDGVGCSRRSDSRLARRADVFPALPRRIRAANALGVGARAFYFPHTSSSCCRVARIRGRGDRGCGAPVAGRPAARRRSRSAAVADARAIGSGGVDPRQASQRIYPDNFVRRDCAQSSGRARGA
jgi:hypothetical protein